MRTVLLLGFILVAYAINSREMVTFFSKNEYVLDWFFGILVIVDGIEFIGKTFFRVRGN